MCGRVFFFLISPQAQTQLVPPACFIGHDAKGLAGKLRGS